MAIKQVGTLRHDLKLLVNEDNIIDVPLVASVLSPEVVVDQTSASMPKLDRGETIRAAASTRRNIDGTSNRGQFSTSTKEYFTEPFIWEEALDEIQTIINSQYYDAQVIASQIANMHILIGREQRVAAAYQYTVGYTTIDAGSSFAATAAWDVPATCTPYADVLAMSDQAFIVSGIRKDQMDLCIQDTLVDAVLKCDEIRADAKFTTNLDIGTREEQANYLRSYLGVKSVKMRSGVYNTAGINGTPVFAEVWDDKKIQLVYTPRGSAFPFPGFSRQPVYGKVTRDRLFDSYVEEKAQQLIIRVQEYRGVQTDYQWGVELTGAAT